MKIGKKPAAEQEPSDSIEGLAGGMSDFAITDPNAYRGAVSASKAMSNRAPEVWVKDGAKVRLRFRRKEPVASFEVYRFKSGGKWVKAVRPGPGKTDLFAEAGMRPSRVFVYEVNDLDGYKDKTSGKAKKFLPRFYVVGIKQFEQLNMVAEAQGLPLTKYDITIRRTGQSTETVYMFIPSPPSPMPEEVKKAERLDWTQHYKPFPVAAQRSLLGAGRSEDEE